MDRKRPRRFSLGDIIRRMNEAGPGADSEVRPAPPAAKYAERSEAPRIREVTRGNAPPNHLPRQPSLGSAYTPPVEPELHRAPPPPEPHRATPAPPQEFAPHDGHIPHQQSGGPGRYAPEGGRQFDSEQEEEFDLFRYVSVVVRRKEIMAATVVVAALFSLFSYLRAPRYYTAGARVLFRPTQSDLLDSRASWIYWRDREKDFNTHLELLRSTAVLERVAEGIDGTLSAAGIRAGLGIQQGETNGEKNDIIEISLRHRSAEVARDALNELCKVYLEYRREVNAQEDTRFIFKLKTQIDKLQAELNSKEDALREFKEENRMVQLSSDANLLVSKLADMELALQQSQLDLLETKEEMTGLRAQIGQQDVNVVQSMTYANPYQSRLAELELQHSTLSAEYSPDHFKMKTISQQIEQLKKAMETEITKRAVTQTFVKNPIRESMLQNLVNQTIRISALEARRTAQEQIIEKLNTQLRGLPSLEQRYAFLQRETGSLLQTLSMLKTRYEEAKIRRDSKETDLKVLELAKTPTRAVSEKKRSSIFVGIFVGLVLGIAIAFLLEYLDQTLKEPGDVEKALDLPLIGLVPLIDAEKVLSEGDRKLTKTVLEPFRALRANLKHLAATHKAKVFMMCSAVKGEGKTTLAANLALTFAMDDKKVVLIDADLRRSQIHQLLGVEKAIGLADYLTGEKGIADVIKHTKHDNLFVVTSGERPHNPAELLGTSRFDEFIGEVRSQGDIIIFDSPALLPVSDTITMAPKMDGCVMVMRALWTPLKAARQARSQLTRIGTKMMGGIFNGISHSRGYYPYYYGYYGYYSYRYSYEDEPKKPSIREFGLRVEARLKKGIENAHITVPRVTAQVAGFLKHLLRRKTFWGLVALLALATIAVIVLESRHPVAKEPWIEKVGAGVPEQIPRPDRESPVEEVPREEARSVASSLSLSAAPAKPTVCDSLLADWVEAVNAAKVRRYLEFYHPADFRYPGGGFDEWAQEAPRKMLHESTRQRIIDIVRISGQDLRGGYRETTLEARAAIEADTIDVRYTMIWAATEQGCSIVREKRSSAVEGEQPTNE